MSTGDHATSNALNVRRLKTVSPSSAESIRNCPLQAALSQCEEAENFVLSNPKAWLGTAYHEVLEKLWLPTEAPMSDEALVLHLWDNAIASLQAKAVAHPLNRRFSEPTRWPGYYLTLEYVKLRAAEALSQVPRDRSIRAESTKGKRGTRAAREKWMVACGGKLVGKPDLCIGNEIRDYKSGNILEPTDDGSQVVKESYLRQLRIYGHLVHENTGKCPDQGKLMPMSGLEYAVALDPEACKFEAESAVDLLDSLNDKLSQHSDNVAAVATPSAKSCKWCSFKTVCPAFWNAVSTDWISEFGSGAVKGTLTRPLSKIHDERAWSMSVQPVQGTVDNAETTILPLPVKAHNLEGICDGDGLRIINLFHRSDESLSPTQATTVFKEVEIPEIVYSAS